MKQLVHGRAAVPCPCRLCVAVHGMPETAAPHAWPSWTCPVDVPADILHISADRSGVSTLLLCSYTLTRVHGMVTYEYV
jgi:hypothetical protein